jgi:hypothetical protein
MRIADSSLGYRINESGFRDWYQYELARSFGYLALGLIALILGLISMEGVFQFRGEANRWLQLVTSFAALCVTGWTWLQFIKLLLNAESISSQAVCRKCSKYGQFEAKEDLATSEPEERVLKVQCKRCQHTWAMFYTVQSGHDKT